MSAGTGLLGLTTAAFSAVGVWALVGRLGGVVNGPLSAGLLASAAWAAPSGV